MNRRRFLQVSATAVTAGAAGRLWSPQSAVALPDERHLRVERIDRVTVEVPYREVPGRNMARELPHWRFSEIFTVTLRSGVRGFGETLLYYTWGATEDEHVRAAMGKNAAELMWDDELGAGLQMALLDAVARTSEVPIHRLLGAQVHEQTPLSWWNIDTSQEDMALECKEAHSQGYMAYKTKGRPWIDVWQQVKQSAAVVPERFKIDLDFNDTLLDAERAIPILKELEAYPQVDIYESPIPQGDIEGNRAIRQATRVAIAMHYGNPLPAVAIREGVCDGFVIGGGASRVMRRGHTADDAEMPFWLQLVGTGITAAFSLHFGAVHSQAVWPAVNCHQLFTHNMLTKPITVRKGMADVPDSPGLGYEVDWDAVDKFRVEKPPRRPDPPRLIETTWPDGKTMYLANNGRVNFMLTIGQQAKMPFFKPGVKTRLVPDDGSQKWQQLYREARRGPVFE